MDRKVELARLNDHGERVLEEVTLKTDLIERPFKGELWTGLPADMAAIIDFENEAGEPFQLERRFILGIKILDEQAPE